jgi:hypothetical protein
MWDRDTLEYVGIIVGIIVGISAIGAAIWKGAVWLLNRTPHPAMSVCIDEHFRGNPPVLAVKIVNDSAAELNIEQPAELVIDDPRYPPSTVRVFHRDRVDDGNTRFPRPLRKLGKIISRESMSQLADDLRIHDCWESCLVRGVFRDTMEHLHRSPRYNFPVSYWLAPDASAHRYIPTGPQRTDSLSRLRHWWADRRARTLYACPRRM